MIKRCFDFIISLLGLLVLCLPLVLISIWIKIDSQGPVFFRQVRVTQFGREFRIFKFRTMRNDAEKKGLQLTVGADPRITKSGAFLRRYKLDELPQLLNVLIGQMSIVGPRPEVPKYVAKYPNDLRDIVLSVRSGITDLASIEFRNENDLLSGSNDPERTYIEKILPIKLEYYVRYAKDNNLLLDLKIIWLTVLAVLRK